MAVTNFIPTLWAASIQQEHDRMSVARLICNLEAEGEVQRAGDQVVFPGLIDPSISTYAGSITWEDIDDASVTMSVDQQKYYAFNVEDIDKVQAASDFGSAQQRRAASKLKDAEDAYVLGLYGDAGNTVTDTTCDTTTILSDISQASRLLDEQDVPMDGRWMVLAPWVKEKLELAGIKFSIREGLPVESGVMWVNYLGFNMYVSNNVTNPTASTGHVTHCVAGGEDALAFAQQLLKTEAIRREDSFSDGVRGLDVYGAKVIRPNDLVDLALTYAAESAI